MIPQDQRRRLVPIFIVSCLMPGMLLLRNGRLEDMRTVDVLLIFASGVGFGSFLTRLFSLRKQAQ